MPNVFRRLARRLHWLFRRNRVEADMAEEMRFHLDMRAEDKMADGLSIDEAHLAARRKFGNLTLIQEQGREAWRWTWWEHLAQDLRYAVRSWRKSPGFTAVAVVSLALGIGVTTAVFSLVNATVIKSLPVKNPDELVIFEWQSGPKGGAPRLVEPDIGSGPTLAFSQRTFETLRKEGAPVVDIFASASMWGVNVTADNHAEIVNLGEMVSGNFYRVLGVQARLGRTISPDDDRPGAEPVAVISHRYWQRRFGGELGVVGKAIRVNRVAATIIGVTPPDFLGTNPSGLAEDIFMPLSVARRFRRIPVFATDPAHAWWLRVGGRLQPSATVEKVRARLEEVFQQSAHDDFIPALPIKDAPLLRVARGGQAKTGPARENDVRLLAAMMGMAGLVLLAACANVAALLLARGASRRPEIAVRLALGSGRARLIRQLLTENISLALFGALVGLLFAHWNLDLLATLFAGDVKEWMRALTLDWHGLGFTIALSVFIGVAFGLVPALRSTRVNLTAEFQAGPRSFGGVAISRLSQILVATQVALCVVLLVCSGLFMRTLVNLDRVNLGFNRANLLLFATDAHGAGYQPEQFAALHESISERIRPLPGVKNVTLSALPWMSAPDTQHSPIALAGSAGSLPPMGDIMWNGVGADFFETYEMPVLSGRGFTAHDSASSPKIAIVNQTMVREYFHDTNPVGKRIVLEGEREIVGVVRDAKQTGHELRGPTASMVFIPFSQDVRGSAFYAVRTQPNSPLIESSVRQAVGAVDPNLPIFMVSTQQERIDGLLLKEKMFAHVAAYLGLVALGLAYVGLYGLISYTVLRRTGEIGVRMALGALQQNILSMILRTSLSIVLVGLLIGFPAACAVTQLISSMLFGLSSNDLFTYSTVAVFVVCIAFIACGLPARRAAKVEPMVALRLE